MAAESHGQDVKNFITDHFYVDDSLISCPLSQEAIDLIHITLDAMKMYGYLRLHIFTSNNISI
jgi:hypothetical protein